MTNLIVFCCLYAVLPLMVFMHYNLAKPKKNLILNVTLPLEARESGDVLAITGRYKRAIIIGAVPLAIAPIPAFFMESSSAIGFLMTWLLAAMLVPVLVYTFFRRRLMALKKERLWAPDPGEAVLVDTKAATMRSQPVATAWFVPPAAMTLLPLIIAAIRGEELVQGLVCLINTAMIALFYVLYRVFYRQRSELIDTNTSLTIALTRIRRYAWARMWLIMTWATGLWSLAFLFVNISENAFLIATLAYSLVLIAVAFYTEFKIRRLQEKLSCESGVGEYVDEDRYWINGMFYFNPNDRHFMKNDRVGLNTTINIAHPAGMAVTAVSALIILSLPFLGLFMSQLERTGVSLEVTGTELRAHFFGNPYVIDASDVTELELLEQLPEMRRVVGVGMPSVLQGDIRIVGGESCKVNLNPRCPPYISLRAGGELYIFGSMDPERTREVYAQFEALAGG